MKTLTLLLLTTSVGTLCGQPTIQKTLPLQSGQKVRMEFDYPNMIRISTWDRNEVSIQGTVSINGGENNDAFKLETRSEANGLFISNNLNLKSIPRRITITRNGQKVIFKDKGALRKYQEENGKDFTQMNDGTDIDIVLEIKVPINTETFVESTYGMVEVKNFSGPLTVKATYGGVDASLTERAMGELKAETNYGHIYTDLDTKFTNRDIDDEDFHMVVSAKLGTGPSYDFESPYGNVYLRKNK